MMKKYLFYANTDWYLFNFRLNLAQALVDSGNEVVMLSPNGKYVKKLVNLGFRWYPVPMKRRSLKITSEIKLLSFLIKIYKKERPDLAHHFTIKCVVYGGIASILAGVPCVNAVTGLGYIFSNNRSLANFLKPLVILLLKIVLAYKNSRLILQNNDDIKLFKEKGIANESKMRLIKSSGVNIEKFKPITDPLKWKTKANDCCNVLLATRLLWDKGVEEFIGSAKILKKNNNINVKFLIAGSPDYGNPTAVPIHKILEWHNIGLIEYLGHVDRIDELLKKVDIVTLASYREGLPRILIEAAANGLPIVATDVPGCREAVEHMVNGILIKEKSADELACAIKYLVENPRERIRMGLSGREKAIKEFDEKIVIMKTIAVYNELL